MTARSVCEAGRGGMQRRGEPRTFFFVTEFLGCVLGVWLCGGNVPVTRGRVECGVLPRHCLQAGGSGEGTWQYRRTWRWGIVRARAAAELGTDTAEFSANGHCEAIEGGGRMATKMTRREGEGPTSFEGRDGWMTTPGPGEVRGAVQGVRHGKTRCSLLVGGAPWGASSGVTTPLDARTSFPLRGRYGAR